VKIGDWVTTSAGTWTGVIVATKKARTSEYQRRLLQVLWIPRKGESFATNPAWADEEYLIRKSK
jgi:hypothetical protein